MQKLTREIYVHNNFRQGYHATILVYQNVLESYVLKPYDSIYVIYFYGWIE